MNCRWKNFNCRIYWRFSSAYSLIVIVILALAASILSFHPERVKARSSHRSSFANYYFFNSEYNGNGRTPWTSSIRSLQSMNAIHHGDEVTSGGTADLSDSIGLEWMKNIDGGSPGGPGSVYDSIVEYDVSYASLVEFIPYLINQTNLM